MVKGIKMRSAKCREGNLYAVEQRQSMRRPRAQAPESVCTL